MTAQVVRPALFGPLRLSAFVGHGKVVVVRPPAAADELAAVLSRIAAGDASALAALYDATASKVFGIVVHVLRDHAQAEEVTQEVYVEAWRAAPRFDPALGSSTAWLNTIAHRKAVDRVRSAERRMARERRDANSSPGGVMPDTAELVVNADEERRVREALSGLTEAQGTALRLAYYEGRSYREVAEYLEEPIGTVKTRIRDALRRLRTQLEEAPQ